MKTTVTIQNLKCGGCAHTITTKISEINNITEVDVNVENSTVRFAYLNEEDTITVKNKLSALGYPIEGDSNSVVSKAKSFVSCATGKMAK